TDEERKEKEGEETGDAKVSPDDTREASWEFDQTSGRYYHKKIGLYYDPASDLYWDYDVLPAVCYHRSDEAGSMKFYVATWSAEEPEDEEDHVEPATPARLYLIVSRVPEADTHESDEKN